ncbi:MAG TPA: ABC transporter ATP-binding protein [Desulfatiglandales bacterium]|nr:ABC transporter ATP-binding protein [Desulfatiglandales bacterium]
MLNVNRLSLFYGKIQVLWDVSLTVAEKEMVAVIGSNASGKTSLLNTISGLLTPSSGTVEFLGKGLQKTPAYLIARLGISHIPEGGGLFPDMKVSENLELGAYTRAGEKEKKETMQWVYEIFPSLAARSTQLAKTLSGGERQMLAIGRGLMSKPRLCMLDEPSYALSPLLVMDVFKAVRVLRDRGTTILLVEQDIKRALEMADRAYLLENGRVVLEGPRDLFLQNDHVKRAYLGL